MIFVVLLEPSFYYTLYLKIYVEYYCKCDIHMNFVSIIGDIVVEWLGCLTCTLVVLSSALHPVAHWICFRLPLASLLGCTL